MFAKFTMTVKITDNYREYLHPRLKISKQIGMGLNMIRKEKFKYIIKFKKLANNLKIENPKDIHIALSEENYIFLKTIDNYFLGYNKTHIKSLFIAEAMKIGYKIYNPSKDKYA